MTGTQNASRINVAAGLAWSALVLAAMVGASVWAWDLIPDGAKVPTHWNARGEVNGHWTKENGLAFAPVVATLITIIFAAVPALGRRRQDIMQSPFFYHTLWAVMMIIFAVVHAHIVTTAVGAPLPISMLIVVGAAFVVLAIAAMLSASFARRSE